MAGFGLGSYPSGAFTSLGSSGTNWGSLLGGSGGGGGFWSSIASGIGGLFSGGGSSGGGGNMWGNIFQGLLGGIGAAVGGGGDEGLSMQERIGLMQEESHEARRNIGFAADMEDFYKQKDKMRKRAALDTYGQFSLLSKYAPNYTPAPPVDPGVRPST